MVVFTANYVHDPQQRALVNGLPAGKTILVALWDPAEMLMFPDIKAVVLGYSPMLRATRVICELLLGERDAFGSLPFRYAN